MPAEIVAASHLIGCACFSCDDSRGIHGRVFSAQVAHIGADIFHDANGFMSHGAAGIERWPQAAPRRTFASCWLAVHSDVNKLNNLMGHTSPEMLWRHYHKAVTRKQAEAFWKIEPPTKTKSKIVRLAA